MVIVHSAVDGGVALPGAVPGDLAWALAEDAAGQLRQRILRGHQAVSRSAVAALLAATADQDPPSLSRQMSAAPLSARPLGRTAAHIPRAQRRSR
jgi:hypothetical protein